MKKAEYTIYKVSELPEHIKEEVLDRNRYMLVEHACWYEYEIDLWKENLGRKGFENVEILSSRFYTQGIGASFTASVNLDYFAKKWPKYERLLDEDVRFFVERISEYSCKIGFESEHLEGEIDVLVEDFIEDLEEIRIDFCRDIYRDLESTYDHLTSDEMITDFLDYNKFYFFANGADVPII